MKQLLFLLLFPCLALAQYTGNAGQKITLGEQTTADGLVFRGLAADTTRKPSVDTMAYILLDTNTNIIWQYKKATNNAWTRVGGSISSGVTGVLPVENGGTNRTTMPAGYILHGDGTSVDTAIGLFWNRNARKLGVGTNTPSGTLDVQGIITSNAGGVQFPREFRNDFTPTFERADLFFFSNFTSDNGFRWGTIASSGGTTFQGTKATDSGVKTNINFNPDGGNVGIGTASPAEKLHVVGNGRFTAVAAGTFANNLNITSDGTLTTATSDEKYKYNILPITYGLNTILQLKPVNFQWIEGEENDLGFIAQDVAEIIPEAVNTNWNSDLLMRYESIIPILTKAIQEQQALIKALEQRILTLENK